MVRLLIGATVLAGAGMVFAPATAASAGPICAYVAGSGAVNVSEGPICTGIWSGPTECNPGQDFLGPEVVTHEECLPTL